ncbi:MAG: ABC transporter permease [Sedimentisphaerales bacterium]|nr:ABC transporter permease [Sedimentisphaerales bacterium]
MMARRPVVTVTAVVILALGIGANTALFTIIQKILLSPLQFSDSERLMMVEPQWKDGTRNGSSSGPDYLDWERRNTVFSGLTALSMGKVNLTKAGDALTVRGFHVTANFFDVFSNNMALGRGFREDEDQSGKRNVAVLSHKLWRRRYNCNPDILNRQIDIDKVPHTVVGVAAETMGFLDDFAEIYVPIDRKNLTRSRGNHHVVVLGRLRDQVTLAQAQSQMSQIARQLSKEYPNTNMNKGIYVGSLQERLISDIRVAFVILYSAVTLLLLVACVNVSNLLLANASGRRREMAIRQALGGGRWRLVRQLLTESMLLGIIGGAMGLLLAFGSLDVLLLIAPKLQSTGTSVPGFSDIRINPTILGFTLALSLLTGLVFGIIPAWQSSGFSLSHTLKQTSKGLSRGPGRHRTLGALVVAQIALAFILLIGAGLLVKSFALLQKRNPGFNVEGLLAIHIDRPRSENTVNDMKPSAFFQQATERLAALPGVESAGATSLRPLNPDNNNWGCGVAGGDHQINSETRMITSDYFRCMGIPLRKGRYFAIQDDSQSQLVVIVNQEFVDRLLPDREPIGREVVFGDQRRTIVGVVGNVAMNTLSSVGYKAFVYFPHTQHQDYSMTIFIRTKGNPVTYADPARKVIRDIDANQPILYITTMSKLALESISLQRFCTILIGGMACVALFMALVGLYAVMAFSVNERSNEVGIRMALGADKSDILLLVIRKAFLLTVIGLVIGLVGALVVSRYTSSILYSISTWDPATFVLVPLLLFIVSMLACYLPARKATRLDPMKVLRYE